MEELYGFRKRLCAPHKKITFEYGLKNPGELDLSRGVSVCGDTSEPVKLELKQSGNDRTVTLPLIGPWDIGWLKITG